VTFSEQVELSAVQQLTIAQRLVEANTESAPRNTSAIAWKVVTWLVWLYALTVAGTWLVLWHGGDRWWPATLMLFGPRWIYGLPLVVLIPLALAVRRRLLWHLTLSAILVVAPIMGCCVPWPSFARSDEAAIRVVVWNMGGKHIDSATLAALINSTQPDVVALQECHADSDLQWPDGWHVCRQRRLVTGSLYPIDAVEFSQREWPPSKWPVENALRCVIQTPNHRMGFVNVHLRTPRQGLQEMLDRRTFIDPSKCNSLMNEIEYRRLESEHLANWIGGFLEPAVIAGDFNMPADSAIYRQFWSKYANAFSMAGCGFGYTKQTEVLGWQYGSRIDHILTDSGWRPRRCWLGADFGSDHLPLIADLDWEGP